MSINISGKKKKIVVIIGVIICLCLVFIGGFYVVNNRSKDLNNKVVSGQTKDDPVKQGIKDMKEIFKPETAFTSSDMDTIDTFIDKYKNEDLVKGDLVNFLIEKAQECVKDDIDTNSDIFSKTSYAFERLYLDYPENETIVNLRNKLSEKELKSNPVNNSAETTQASISTKLTSSDGMLELEDKYSQDGYVCGTIKNLSESSYSYVEVDINLYDSENNQVDSTISNINNLAGYGTWNFRAVVVNQKNVSKFRVVNIQGVR